MDVRTTKTIHSFHDFAVEIGTITLGILIALALEALVQQYRDERLVSHARSGLIRELEINREAVSKTISQERAATKAISRILATDRISRDKGNASPISPPPLTFRSLDTSTWDSAISTQSMAHMQYDDAQVLSQAYAVTRNFSDLQQDASRQWIEFLASYDIAPTLDHDELLSAKRQAAISESYQLALIGTGTYLISVYDKTLSKLKQVR